METRMRPEITKLFEDFHHSKYLYEKTGFLEHFRTASELAKEIMLLEDLCKHRVDDRSAYDGHGYSKCLVCGAVVFLVNDWPHDVTWDWKYPAELEVKIV